MYVAGNFDYIIQRIIMWANFHREREGIPMPPSSPKNSLKTPLGYATKEHVSAHTGQGWSAPTTTFTTTRVIASAIIHVQYMYIHQIKFDCILTNAYIIEPRNLHSGQNPETYKV